MPEFTTGDGVRLHYREAGTREGRPIVFLPGWGGTTRYFDRQFDLLPGTFRLLALDPRSQGRSERTTRGQRIARWARDVNELLLTLDVRDVVLVGWSFGATAALQHADLFGEGRVTKLVLISPGVCQLNHGDWQLGGFDLTAADQLRTGVEAAFDDTVRSVVPTFFHATPPPETMKILIEDTLLGGPPHAAAALFWDGVCQDLRDTLPHVRQPTLVVLGRHDRLVNPATARLFSDLPDGRVELFEHSGHSPFLEESERFCRVLNEFSGN